MNQSNGSDNNQARRGNNLPQREIVGISIFCLVLFAGVVWLSLGFEKNGERISFIAQSSLNVLIFGAIAIQAVIYHGQWSVMQESLRQTEAAIREAKLQTAVAQKQLALASSPRLHVDGIAVYDFEKGQSPTFFIVIMNTGPVAAIDILLKINLSLAADKLSETPDDLKVRIPANGKGEYLISGLLLTEEEWTKVNQFDPGLRIDGYFKEKDKDKEEFCYRYYPWNGKRPESLKEFLPCDYKVGNLIYMSATGEWGGGITSNGGKIEPPEKPPES